MQIANALEVTDPEPIARELRILSAVAPSDAPFLSCYIDASIGQQAAIQDFRRRARAIRRRLAGAERIDFDIAHQMTITQLERHWPQRARGVAVFARGLAGGRYLSSVQTGVPFVSQLVWYRVPEILPLLQLCQEQPATRVLLGRDGEMSLLDLEHGLVHPRALAKAHLLDARRDLAARTITRFDHPLQGMRRKIAVGDAPLLIAGDQALLPLLEAWLPGRARGRLVRRVALPGHLDDEAAIDTLRQSIAAAQREQASRLVAQFAGRVRAKGNVAAGSQPVLQALRDGRAETLLLAERRAADDDTTHWDPPLELARMASEQGIPVLVTDAPALRYLGGVGCLLSSRPEHAAMPLPCQPPAVDLVA